MISTVKLPDFLHFSVHRDDNYNGEREMAQHEEDQRARNQQLAAHPQQAQAGKVRKAASGLEQERPAKKAKTEKVEKSPSGSGPPKA
jgi:hypothetical protein